MTTVGSGVVRFRSFHPKAESTIKRFHKWFLDDYLQSIDIDLDCRKTCLKGTLNAACDACLCDDHVLTGRVQTTNNAPIAGAKVAFSETPYKALARTDEKGFFKALNVCADANQELLISAAGFVPVKTVATISSSKTANVQVKLQTSGTCFIFFQLSACPNTLKTISYLAG